MQIALQFPDELLFHAPEIVQKLKAETNKDGTRRHICILGDTSYGACCVDEVAAQRILSCSYCFSFSLTSFLCFFQFFLFCLFDILLDMNADFIVHYGRACMNR